MRCLSLPISRGVLFCLFVAILRVSALVVIPSDALPQLEAHPTLDADDAPSASEHGPPAWDWDWDRALSSHSPGPRPAPPIPTVTRVLPSHAPWYAQLPPEEATSSGHTPATVSPMPSPGGRPRNVDANVTPLSLSCPKQGTSQSVLDDGADNAVAWQRPSPREQFASWIRSRASERGSESDHTRRRRPSPSVSDGARGDGGPHDSVTSEDSKVSVLALAVVGVVLACHYLDYL